MTDAPIITIQDDAEIPTHIISVVSAQMAKAEEAFAKHRRLRQRFRVQEKTKTHANVGLTINAKSSNTDTASDVIDESDVNNVGLLLRSHSKSQQTKTKRPSSRTTGTTEPSNSDLELDEDDGLEHDKENADVSGRDIFGFTKTKARGAHNMMKKAIGDEETQAESKRGGRTKRRTQKRAAATVDAEEQDKALSSSKKRRIQRQIELLKDDAQSEEEEEESDDKEDEEESEDEERANVRPAADEESSGYDRYFQDLHHKSSTSNNTMSKLPVLEPQEFNAILKKAPKKHEAPTERLSMMHQEQFPQWYFELQSGFNLVFYGYGSKRHLLNTFASTALTDGALLVVNGFFPSVTVKDILYRILSGVLNMPSSTGQLLDQASLICKHFSRDDRVYDKLYLVIHNIDGSNLRNERTQLILSMLASTPNIHLIASIDQINAGLLWDNVKGSRFNWIWHDLTTYDDYLVETSFENSLLMRTGELGGARGVQYVLRSLTSNARGVFRVLAEHQLVEMEVANSESVGNESVGLAYHRYYQLCREGFFVSTDMALRAQLTEFMDHQIIASKRQVDGTEVFFIPLDKTTLASILEEAT